MGHAALTILLTFGLVAVFMPTRKQALALWIFMSVVGLAALGLGAIAAKLVTGM